jgi:hypothetical protein
MYTWITLTGPDEIWNLAAHVGPEYAPDYVAERLAECLSGAVKGVLIELSYIDKDYRSTYYHFYAKMGRRYLSDCVRLHFFDETVSFNETALRLLAKDGKLEQHYFGFMVLRPTGVQTIGRSVLSPDVRKGAPRSIIAASHKAHVLGHKLKIHGFPSMDQHRDIAVCAHAACWSILRHYSERYSLYREYLLHDITRLSQEFDPGGLIPSRGLAIPQAERVFQEAGTYPIIVARELDDKDDGAFYRQLAAYVDSGFPLFAAMHDKEHAMAVVGYDWREPLTTGVLSTRYSWDEMKALAVVDDHHLPYAALPKDGDPDATLAVDIDTFIVPLPEKVYYPADAVDRLLSSIFGLGDIVDLPNENEAICRYFITTASAFRHFVRRHESEFDVRLVALVMQLRFAQFLWIVEISTEAQWAAHRVGARVVIDATASITEDCPYWLFHGLRKALVFERNSVHLDVPTGMAELDMAHKEGFSGFTRMETNLRPW